MKELSSRIAGIAQHLQTALEFSGLLVNQMSHGSEFLDRWHILITARHEQAADGSDAQTGTFGFVDMC